MSGRDDGKRHREAVRESFEKQAEDFSRSPVMTDAARLAQIVEWANVTGPERVIDVACGPGLVASAFAPHVRLVVGVDLTPAMIRRGVEVARTSGAANVRYLLGDGERLPFADGTFDRVISRRAFHHFPDPIVNLREMARVCVPGGGILIEDQAPPADPRAADTITAIDRLRDPSHTQAVDPGEWEGLFEEAGLVLEAHEISAREMDFDEWMTRAYPAPGDAARAREMLEAVIAGELPGPAARRVDGALKLEIGFQILRGARRGRAEASR